jgi:hypothetical protein
MAGPHKAPTPPRHPHAALLQALSIALQATGRTAPGLARGLSELGSIELPDDGPASEPPTLQAAAPLYFASELEAAGLLPTAELVAGLFASGAITQPLGPAARLVNDYWRSRRERLDEGERSAIFARVVEQPYFGQLMRALCAAIVAQADGTDLRERVQLETAAVSMARFLGQRTDPMAVLAAGELVANIDQALGFLRDRMLQQAFGTRSLWQLVAVAGAGRGQGAGDVQRHVDQGQAGQTVLLWLAREGGRPAPRLDPADLALIGAAQRWLAGDAAAAAPPLPAAA